MITHLNRQGTLGFQEKTLKLDLGVGSGYGMGEMEREVAPRTKKCEK